MMSQFGQIAETTSMSAEASVTQPGLATAVAEARSTTVKHPFVVVQVGSPYWLR